MATNYHKIATNQSLNQKSRCFYIGALFFYISNLLLNGLNLQILNWLSHYPTDMESYIRPGCVILTIYLHLPNWMWDE